MLASRQAAVGGWRRIAQQVRDAAEGKLAVPLPEQDEVEAPATANLIVSGIDQTGMRLMSTRANIRFVPTKPGQKRAEDAARSRRAAMESQYDASAGRIVDRRRGRWFVAYGRAPVVMRPYDGRIVREARDPLTCFPAPSADPDSMMSDNCVFAVSRPWWWVQQNFPGAAQQLRRPKTLGGAELIQLVEYVDSETWSLVAAAPVADGHIIERVYGESYGTPGYSHAGPQVLNRNEPTLVGSEQAVLLAETDNRSGICPVVDPKRICLGEIVGQFDQMIGVYAQAAKLMALEVNAVTESVYPPLWAIQNQNEQLEIVRVADGKRGIVGELHGGTLVPIQLQPGFQTYPTIDRLERTQRLNGSIPADYGGETSGSQVRTGRQGELLMSAVVDFPIQEGQEVFARSRWHEHMCTIAIGRGHYPNKSFSFSAAWRARGLADYEFAKLFPDAESAAHDVTFPFPGTDANGALIRVAQKMGVGILSKQTAREMDFEIDDAELEKDRIDAEALEDALRASIAQQAATGALAPGDVARITQLVRSDRMDLAEAIMQAQQEAQQRQATVAPAGSPETQPGLAQPGVGAEQPAAVGPSPDLAGLVALSGALRLGQRQAPQEQQAGAVAALGA